MLLSNGLRSVVAEEWLADAEKAKAPLVCQLRLDSFDRQRAVGLCFRRNLTWKQHFDPQITQIRLIIKQILKILHHQSGDANNNKQFAV